MRLWVSAHHAPRSLRFIHSLVSLFTGLFLLQAVDRLRVFAGNRVIKISPRGGGFVMEIIGPSLPLVLRYRGSFTSDAKKPSERGAGTFVECRTSTNIPGSYNEVLSINFKGK